MPPKIPPKTPVRTVMPSLLATPPGTPPDLYASNVDFFLQMPWTADLLQSSSVPAPIPLILQCRNPASPAHDQFFGKTLLSPSAISHMLSVAEPTTAAELEDPDVPLRRVTTLFHVGHGLSGGPTVLHGGCTMAMVDEAMGAVSEVNAALGKQGAAFSGFSVTGGLEVRFVRPVYTGCVVAARATLEGVEGRKVRVRCEVVDGEGGVLATCGSIWVATAPAL